MDAAEGSARKRETLRKYEILRGHGAIERVFREGKKVNGKLVSVFYLPNPEKKVAFVASRQYRKAVKRNRVKRLLREIYRKNKDLFPDGHWILYGKFFDPIPDYHQLKQDVIKTMEVFKKAHQNND
jgi:ribonuclease P protein component